MKLTNFQRESIIRAIFQDVPHAKSSEIKNAVQMAIVDAMSADCRKAYKACPDALKTTYTYDLTFERDSLTLIVGDADLKTVLKPWEDAKKEYLSAKFQLTALINSASTLKQLTEMLPEFVSYFPVEGQPTKNLPAVTNTVTMLVKLGWTPK